MAKFSCFKAYKIDILLQFMVPNRLYYCLFLLLKPNNSNGFDGFATQNLQTTP